MEGTFKPDQQKNCARCGKRIYRWLVYEGDTLVKFLPWKHYGTGSEYCNTETAHPDAG